MPDSQSDLNDQINEFVTAGNSQGAVKMLYDAVVSAAKNKDFVQAEALLEQIYDIDAMALTEIVKSGEIIEQEKSKAINSSHKQIWSSLYKGLSREEANAFFFAMEEKQVDTDHTIIKQGQLPSGLLLINKGQAKTVWKDAGTEVLLAKLGPGDVAGHDTFFDISVATTSLIALTPVHYSLLIREKTADWDHAAPSLLYRLKEYFRQVEKPCDWVSQRGIERRRHQRFRLEGDAKLQLLNSAGIAIGKPLKSFFSNISKGGVSVEILLPNQKTAVTLLGRSVRMVFSMGQGKRSVSYEMIGTINAVSDLWQNEFAVHVRFDIQLPASLMSEFSNLNPLAKTVTLSVPAKQQPEES
jgi:hypothetical protein